MPPDLVIVLIALVLLGGIVGGIVAYSAWRRSQNIDAARSELRSGDPDQAMKILRRLVAANPDSVEAHYLLGETYSRTRKYDWSVHHLRKVKELNDYSEFATKEQTMRMLSQAYFELGYLTDSQKELLALVEDGHEDAEVLNRLGMVYLRKQAWGKASQVAAKVLNEDEDDPSAMFILGVAQSEAGDRSRGRQHLERALRFRPEMHEARYYIGVALAKENRFQEALTELENAMRSPHVKHRAIYEIGRTQKRQGDIAAAILSFERGLKLINKDSDPVAMQIRYQKGLCHEERIELREAVTEWEIVATQDPDFEDVQSKLSYYNDLRGDDNLRDLHTADAARLDELLNRIFAHLNMDARAINSHNSSVTDVEGSVLTDGAFMGGKRERTFMRVIRASQVLTERDIKSLMAAGKEMGADRYMLVSTADVAPSALEFIKDKNVDIYSRDKLSALLGKAEEGSGS